MYGYYELNKSLLNIIGVIGFDTDFLIFNFPLYLELTSMKYHKHAGFIAVAGYQHKKLLRPLHCKQKRKRE